MSTELIVKLDTSPELLTPHAREQIETAALAIAVSLGICGFTTDFHKRRDLLVAKANGEVKQITEDKELETAVSVARKLYDFRKEVESQETALKRSLNDPKTKIIRLMESELASFLKAESRLSDMINGYQREQIAKREAADRAAELERQKAQREAAEAQRRIEEQQREIERQKHLAEQAKTAKAREAAQAAQRKAESEQLAAQLQQEEAAMDQQAAETQLAAPTNTPRGMVTKVRFDFEITIPLRFIHSNPRFWMWKASEETFKLDRAGLLKELNKDGCLWQPPEGQNSIALECGIRCYRDVSTHVRS